MLLSEFETAISINEWSNNEKADERNQLLSCWRKILWTKLFLLQHWRL